MCREDALEYGDFYPEGIMPLVRGTEDTTPVARLIRRATPEEIRRNRAMTPEQRLDAAFELIETARALAQAPPT
ncbi:MAG: hypothetical protein WDA16_08570 [Candidatus Thermoplasmatota archaeon]